MIIKLSNIAYKNSYSINSFQEKEHKINLSNFDVSNSPYRIHNNDLILCLPNESIGTILFHRFFIHLFG